MPERIIPLPGPRLDGPVSLEAAITARRSVRRYASTELSLEQIGQLLWAAQGITGRKANLRAAPSAGACHPLEFYVCQADGVWHYEHVEHRLVQHLARDVRTALVEGSYHQKFLAQAPCVLAISAVYDRTTRGYADRGRLRYVPMDLGHAAENVNLQAVALGLGSVCVGAFSDNAIREALDLPPGEEPIYMIPVGYPAE